MSNSPSASSAFKPVGEPVTASWLRIGGFDAYCALPPAGRGPGLLLLQEIFGVNAHIRRVAEQYALAGFTVLAPDLFWRQAPRVELGYVGEERDRALALMKALAHDDAVADMGAAVAALRALPACNGRVAALGYCMGGRLAYAAATQCGVDRAVAYYGGGIATRLDLAPAIGVPVLFHHAGHDESIPPEAVAAVRAAMAASPAAALAEFHDYPDAKHGFNCWARAAYEPASAALAHARSLAFLAPLFA
ncbi:dienelactone hydrolase family protein [Derxia gummosa]|uniref:Dienelactone hydrolase family protein n=1 Tax=Derxia gummosa DSM 723 TaxID=1121388 RepID=A0A8B6XA26_9BURK|nr:dienelactone hydrolase family protein [Derxia gummosa]